jgi:hypothetical protein
VDVTLRGSNGNNTYTVTRFLPGSSLKVIGGTGDDRFNLPGGPNSIPGLVSWYKGEGNAIDSAGTNNGTLFGGVTFVPGKVGQAFRFNGTNSYVSVPYSPTLEPTTVSVEAWVNSSTISTLRYILAKGADGVVAVRGSYALHTGLTGGLFFYVYNGATAVLSPDAGPGIWDGNWHHVVGTYDGANVRLFVDGAEVGNGTPTNIRIAYGLPTTNNLFLGSYRGDTTSIFNGLVDEPSVYNRALSPAEIQAIFAAGSAGKTGVMGLVGSRVTLDGGPGTNTLDYSAFTGNVLVNLRRGEATGVLGGLSNIQNVVGGTGGVTGSYNILVGNGANVLTGGNGRRNLLIAGNNGVAGSTLIGGDQDDILIGGTTIYDGEAGMVSLQAIMNYWAGSGDDYATRVNNLTTGTGVPLLDATTVTGNGLGNTLTGNAGLDLFYGNLALDTYDWDPATETFVSV